MIYRSVSKQRIIRAHRENFLHLLDAFSDLPGARPLFTELPEGVVPYEFPLWLDDMDHRFPELEDLAVPGGGDWLSYVAGVAWALGQDGVDLPGLDFVVDGDVPIGAGLSSSAALEMAAALALCEIAGVDWDPVRMARIAQRGHRSWPRCGCGSCSSTIRRAFR